MLTIGQTAPDFELPNQDGRLIRLHDQRGKKVILFAFPKANTAGCTDQACGFRDVFPQIELSAGLVLGISADRPAQLAAWKTAKRLQYDLLSDPDHQVMSAWGAWGINLRLFKLPIAATRSFWVLDEQGILVAQQIGVSPLESVEKALAALDRLNQSA